MYAPRPRRPYRSLEDFRRSIFGAHLCQHAKVPDHWPCVGGCLGRGWVYREEDRDIIEGYKLAPRYPCSCCNGTGRNSREVVRAAYKVEIEGWRKRAESWDRQEALRKNAIAKLTKEEKQALAL